MTQRILIIGTGFGGVWSALSAKRLLRLKKKETEVEVVVVAPNPTLVVRPRLYEADAANMKHDLGPLFKAVDIKFVQGFVEAIDTLKQTVTLRSEAVDNSTLGYDRLVLAAGSAVVRPKAVQGIVEYSFDIDSIEAASRLQTHLENLAHLPASTARDTVVVCGGGFTGIELATELPSRLSNGMRVVLVDGNDEVGHELGPGPRPTITKALKDLGVETNLGSAIASIDDHGVTLKSGERIETMTAIWTAGVRASSLTQHISGTKDGFGRIHVDNTLCVPGSKHVFVTGDSAHALADPGSGKAAMMSCQHALLLGRVSGNNAAADLIDEPKIEYSQKNYNCCLDLGGFGAVICRGWEKDVMLEGDLAKRVKKYINGTLIYPPQDVAEAIASADPSVNTDSNELFKEMLAAVKAAA